MSESDINNFLEEDAVSGGIQSVFNERGVEIYVSRSKMRAYLKLALPPEGVSLPTVEEMKDSLASLGIVHGIHLDRLEKVLTNKLYDSEIVFAEGTPAVDGRDAEIQLIKKTTQYEEVQESGSKKSIDHRERGLILNIKKGDVLGLKKPSTEGTIGKNIFGAEISPKKGKDKPLRAGKNTELSPDGLKIVSICDGSLVLKDGRLSVVEVYKVSGDVSYGTGNIDFNGSVVINGSVLSGFKVSAKDNIEVFGIVEGADIDAGGSVHVHGGINGGDKAFIKVSGDLIAGFLENVKAEIKGDVKVEGSIMNCEIQSDKSIFAGYGGRKQGIIAGGKLVCRDHISANVLGSELEVPTSLQVGSDPKLLAELEETKTQFETGIENLKKVSQLVMALKAKKGELGEKFPQVLQDKLLSVIETETQNKETIQGLKTRLDKLEAEWAEMKKGTIRADKEIYGGVSVKIGKYKLRINRPSHNICFFLVKQEIQTKASKVADGGDVG